MKLLTTPSTISKIQTMANRALRLQVDTNESLTDQEITEIMSNYEKFGYFCFLVEKDIKPEDVADLPKLDEADRKTPSQRLRDVMYIEWKQKTKEYQDKYPFEVYYRGQMERIIEQRKEKLL